MIALVVSRQLRKAKKGESKAGHKYTRRERGADGRWRYTYDEPTPTHAARGTPTPHAAPNSIAAHIAESPDLARDRAALVARITSSRDARTYASMLIDAAVSDHPHLPTPTHADGSRLALAMFDEARAANPRAFYPAPTRATPTPDGAPQPPAGSTQDEALAYIEPRIAGNALESAHVIAPDGTVVMQLGGTKDMVDFNGVDFSLLRNATLTHNHPSGGSFSGQDVYALIMFDLAAIRAVGSTYTYTLTYTRQAFMDPTTVATSLARAYETKLNELYPVYCDHVRKGVMDETTANMQHTHDVVTYLAETFPSATYTRTRTAAHGDDHAPAAPQTKPQTRTNAPVFGQAAPPRARAKPKRGGAATAPHAPAQQLLLLSRRSRYVRR